MCDEKKFLQIREIRKEAKCATPKELRKLHRELKKINHEDGFPIEERYPELPMQISIVSAVVSGILLLLTVIVLLLK